MAWLLWEPEWIHPELARTLLFCSTIVLQATQTREHTKTCGDSAASVPTGISAVSLKKMLGKEKVIKPDCRILLGNKKERTQHGHHG